MYSKEYQYPPYIRDMQVPTDENRETFGEIKENPFVEVASQPVSTFSVDVDRAAYSNIRRIMNILPPMHKHPLPCEWAMSRHLPHGMQRISSCALALRQSP